MSDIPDSLCYLNGEFGALRDMKVSVLDRGFLFGDGIYEVMPVYGRRIFRFDDHMARLARNLGKIRIPNPLSSADWLAASRRVIEAAAAEDQLLYLQVTRGSPRASTRCCRT